MSYQFLEYSFLGLYIIVSLLLSSVLFGISYILTGKQSIQDFEKLSAYECGFDPFSDTHIEFDVRFYLVSILFIIFDLEIMFFFPFSQACQVLNFFDILAFFAFIIILSIGFAYEWINGALEWS